MSRVKLAYIGGGSSRAAGTMASLISRGQKFAGSEVVLIDPDAEHLREVQQIATKMAAHEGVDFTITATTDQRAGLEDCDGVLTSFRPGGFELRQADELIPVHHGVIGQETQGPGGLMMSLRSIQDFQSILADLDAVAPTSIIFNYTNPVNIVSQALVEHTDRTVWSLCEGPITFWHDIVRLAGLDIDRCHVMMAGVNHNCWSTVHEYDGQDMMPLLDEAWQRVQDDPAVNVWDKRMFRLAVTMRSIPASYFKYYYFGEEYFREAQRSHTSRAGQIIDRLPGMWQHYREQADAEVPVLDPTRSRGGVHELEVAIDVMAAYYNDEGAVLPVNLPNTGGALPGFDDETVVEMMCTVDGSGVHPLPQKPLPLQVRGLTVELAEFQRLAARAAWGGTRRDAIQALVAHPFVRNLTVAEELYDDLARANRDYLPERLW